MLDLNEYYSTMIELGIDEKYIKIPRDYYDLKKLYHKVIQTREILVVFAIEKTLISYDHIKYELFLEGLLKRYGYHILDCFYDPDVMIKEMKEHFDLNKIKDIIIQIVTELETSQHIHPIKRFCFYLMNKGVELYVKDIVNNQDDFDYSLVYKKN